MYYWDKREDVEVLQGKTITNIDLSNDKEILIIETSDGQKYKMFHIQDCCEHVYLEDVVGELDDLVGSPLVRVEEVTSESNPDDVDMEDRWQDSFTWTFYHFTTQDGYDVTLRWYGESNGYYSERVDFVNITEN